MSFESRKARRLRELMLRRSNKAEDVESVEFSEVRVFDESLYVCVRWCPLLIRFVRCGNGDCESCSVEYLKSQCSVVGGC